MGKKKIKKNILELIPFEIDDIVYLLDLDNNKVYTVDETKYIGKLIDNKTRWCGDDEEVKWD